MPSENNHLTPNQQKEVDTLNWKIDFQKKIVGELNNNQIIQDYFKGFTPDSVNTFIEYYSIQKSNWHQHGALWTKVKEDHDLKWTEAAWWHLELIQQKKLFDIQCLWRAEKIQLPGIKLSCDFSYWEKNILNCPFVDPVSEDEVELYQEYLETENVQLKDEFEMFLSFQNYHLLKEAFSSEDSEHDFPEWYEFYNSRKGTASLLELPDIRGDKERFYINLGRSAERKQAIAEVSAVFHQKAGEYTDKQGRKILNAFSPESLDFFVDAFEDKQTKEYYKAYAWAHKDDEEEEHIMEDIKLLMSMPSPVPVEENDDWREALREAARRCTIELISEHLPEALGQYQMNKSMNIAFPEKETSHVMAAKELLVKDILAGRKLNGESEDLNF